MTIPNTEIASTDTVYKDSAVSESVSRNSCVYRGQIYHKRFTPREHSFNYELDYFYLDLDEINDLVIQSGLFSEESTNLVSFKRQDFLPSGLTLKQEVYQQIYTATGDTFTGKVCLLATLRSLGYCMNPIALFYCFGQQNELSYVVAEVHNTPWNERHVYVLEGPDFTTAKINTNKSFHVSPFMPMDTDYEWNLGDPTDVLNVHIKVNHKDNPLFDASMKLNKIRIDSSSLNGLMVAQAKQSFKMISGIYIQALKLWLKKVPFYSHPNKNNYQGTQQ